MITVLVYFVFAYLSGIATLALVSNVRNFNDLTVTFFNILFSHVIIKVQCLESIYLI